MSKLQVIGYSHFDVGEGVDPLTNGNYLSQRVREARGDLSLREFAKRCGISAAYVQKIEGASYKKPKLISINTLAKLIRGGVKIDFEQLMAATMSESEDNDGI